MSLSSAPSFGSDRRRFLKLVGLAGISSAVGAAMSAYAQPGVSKPKPAPAKPAAPASPADTTHAANAQPEISDDARALASIVKRRFGQHLSAKDLEAVTQDLDNAIGSGKRLRKFKLANGDEPDFTFRP